MNQSKNKLNSSSNVNKDDLLKYLESLQDSWYDITAIYRTPISSILPEERQVETALLFDDIEIDACYDRFSSWEGSLSKKKIRDWLNQFETTLEQNIAYLLLRKLQFFSITNIESATRSLQHNLLDLLLKKENLWQGFRDDPKVKLKDNEAEFKKWLRNKIIRYAELPYDAAESQHRLWGIYERSALTATSVPDGKKMKPLREYFQAGTGSHETSVFVFMDYTNASGEQLSKSVKKINQLRSEQPEWQKSLFVFMYVVESKAFRIEDIELRPQNSQTLAYNTMLHYKSTEIMTILADNQISESEYDNFIEKYCLRASGKSDAGYRDSGTLTCHHYSCPNNTLPFFHKLSNNWEPLFRNSQTPSATRYKTK
jgi:hypothetical protein